VTYHPSRKQFFGQLFGLAAACAAVPKLLAKPFTAASRAGDASGAAAKMPVEVRTDARAVARRSDSI
jgi:hypothetical protein